MQPTVDPKKVKADAIVLIGDIKVVVEDVSKRPMVSGNRSILLSRGWSFPIIIEPTVVVQHQSTFNRCGLL